MADRPREAYTPAMRRALASAAAPMAHACTRAGLVSGPSTLKAVGKPRALRTGAAKRIEGWTLLAKRKAMPIRSKISRWRTASTSRDTPMASSTSAEPDLDVEARLPCLTMGMPAAARAIADIVEMLTVPKPSPPVPTTSRERDGRSTASAWSCIASARPWISSTVAPLMAMDVRNEARRASPSSPVITWSITQ